MKAAFLAAILLLGACEREAANEMEARNEAPQNSAEPTNEAAPDVNNSGAAELSAEVPQDGAGLADMSPYQRRAYEQGYRDCRAGRYAPDPWPEAYRIGCGAAQGAEGE